MTVNVEELTREQLENIVIQQSKQLKAYEMKCQQQENNYQKLEEDYDTLANVVLSARQVLNGPMETTTEHQ